MTAVATVNMRIERPASVGLSLVGINRSVKSLQEVGSWQLVGQIGKEAMELGELTSRA